MPTPRGPPSSARIPGARHLLRLREQEPAARPRRACYRRPAQAPLRWTRCILCIGNGVHARELPLGRSSLSQRGKGSSATFCCRVPCERHSRQRPSHRCATGAEWPPSRRVLRWETSSRAVLRRVRGEAPGSAPNLSRRLGFQIGPRRAPLSAPPPTWRLGTARNPVATRQGARVRRPCSTPVRRRPLNRWG